ncbi:MAG: tRNA (N6-isopentenyl adenosine(37)-C2)-methylthiotransferase MiaB [bacterium]|nr:tRNA (N6-isopentenyl adenosine(37)-C2)-methylthiotransferase MiaB [bacterium]
MKYHIITFGCQMNMSDSERLASVLDSLKYKSTPNIKEANLIVVTMCSVRQTAVDRVHGLMPKFKEIKKINKNLKTILTGCVLKKDKKIFVKGFDCVIDIKDIKSLSKILKSQRVKKHRDSRAFSPDNYLDITPKYSNKFSANVPIMTGCNNFCSYCVVPYAREKEVSRPAEEIVCEIKNLIDNNYKEIWLLGQNVNSYKDKKVNFPKLLKLINAIPGNFWIRFTSSHPKDFSEELIKTMANCKKYKLYLNLPLQSGDNKILKKMNRPYTADQYKNLINKIRKSMPDIALSTDVIVGFPEETKKQFENTAKLFKDIKFDMAYINKYSPRAGTVAEKLKDNVSKEEKNRREKVLTEILKITALSHNKKLIGKEIMVLIDSQKNNLLFGKNEQYKTVRINIQHPTPKNRYLVGKFVKVKAIEALSWSLRGELINE